MRGLEYWLWSHAWSSSPPRLIDGTDSSLDLLHVIQPRITVDFGIKYMSIQLKTVCCEPDDIHCALRKLTDHHHKASMFADHH